MFLFLVIKDLVLIPVHTKPEDAERELHALHDVVKAVKKKWRINVSRQRQNIRIRRIKGQLLISCYFRSFGSPLQSVLLLFGGCAEGGDG